MNMRLPIRATVVAALCLTGLTGCAALGKRLARGESQPAAATGAEPATAPAPGEPIGVDEIVNRKMGTVKITSCGPGWARVQVEPAPGARPFEAVLPPGRVLLARKTEGLAYLTLAGAIVPASPEQGMSALVPVASLSGRTDESENVEQPTTAARAAGGESFRLDDSPMRAELHEIAVLVSSPQRPWRPARGEAIVVPHDCRHLKRAVFAAEAGPWARARDFFAERTPIQLAVWMLLYNFGKTDLDRELVVYGPRLQLLTGAPREAALERTVADAFALWVALGYDPSGSRLGSEYPKLVQAAKDKRKTSERGEGFPGASSPLASISLQQAADPGFLAREGLVVRADYEEAGGDDAAPPAK